MNPYEKKHMLDGLDELSVENLKAGRITRTAMAFAVLKTGATASNACFFDRGRLGGCLGGSESDRMLADMLNDMLEATKPSEEAPPPKPTPSEYNGIEGFIPELKATVRECIGCGCLVPGGPTRCKRCAREVKLELEEGDESIQGDDAITYFEMARIAMDREDVIDQIAEAMDLSDDELARLGKQLNGFLDRMENEKTKLPDDKK